MIIIIMLIIVTETLLINIVVIIVAVIVIVVIITQPDLRELHMTSAFRVQRRGRGCRSQDADAAITRHERNVLGDMAAMLDKEGRRFPSFEVLRSEQLRALASKG